MPSKSQSQQSAFGMALAARRGDVKPDELYGAARKLFRDKSLSDDQLADYAETNRKGLPRRTSDMQRRQIRAKR